MHFERSTNGGKSWEFIGPVNDGHDIQAIQPSILFHPNNRLQALGRTQQQARIEAEDLNTKLWPKLKRELRPGTRIVSHRFIIRDVPPKRTIVFLAVTAEEQGLLGSRWYGQHPLYPLNRTLADINMDAMNAYGRTKSIVSLGVGQSSLEALLVREAAKDGRTVKADPESEKGYFYRADHFEFARQGVPALSFLFPGTDYLDKPAGYEQKVRGDYITRDYHKPTDDVKGDWDLTGMVDDTRLLFRVALTVADGTVWPTWTAGSEFRARREAALQRR